MSDLDEIGLVPTFASSSAWSRLEPTRRNAPRWHVATASGVVIYADVPTEATAQSKADWLNESKPGHVVGRGGGR